MNANEKLVITMYAGIGTIFGGDQIQTRYEQHENYLEVYKHINLNAADVCILEHNFRIFGR